MRALLLALCCLCSLAHAAPLDTLRSQAPVLADLLTRYPQFVRQFEQYADTQGFTQPYEKLATVVHELIHVDSAAYGGYFVDGQYLPAYADEAAWQGVTNAHVLPFMGQHELGELVVRLYIRRNPQLTLRNVFDEINAYTHVLPLVCQYEPGRATDKQWRNLNGMVGVVEAYLRTLRAFYPAQYRALRRQPAVVAAMQQLLRRAFDAASFCQRPLAAGQREWQAFWQWQP